MPESPGTAKIRQNVKIFENSETTGSDYLELSDSKNDKKFEVSMIFLVRMEFLSGRESGTPTAPQARAVHIAGPNPPKSTKPLVSNEFQ